MAKLTGQQLEAAKQAYVSAAKGLSDAGYVGSANVRQTNTAQQYGARVSETTKKKFEAPKPSLPVQYAQGIAGAVGSGAKFLGGVAETTAKDVGRTLYTGTVGVLAQGANLIGIQQQQDAGKQFDEAISLYKQGLITKDDFDQRFAHATSLSKTASKTSQVAGQVASATIQKKEDGSVNTKEALISVISGTATLATLPLAGIGGVAGKTAAQGTAVATKSVARQQVGQVATLLSGEVKNTAMFAARSFEQLAASTAKTTTSDKVAKLFYTALTKNPGTRAAYRSLIGRAGTSMSAKSVTKDVAIELMLRAPMRRENMRFAVDTVQAFRDDNWFMDENKMGVVPAVILQAGYVVEGGPLGFAVRNFKHAGGALKNAMYGEVELIDELGKLANSEKYGMTGNILQSLNRALAKNAKFVDGDAKAVLQQWVGTNMQKGTAANMAAAIMDAFARKNLGNTAGKSLDELWDDVIKQNYAQNLLQDANKKMGLVDGYIVAAKYDKATADTLQKGISQALNASKQTTNALADPAARLAARKEAAKQFILQQAQDGAYWAQNDDVVDDVIRAIDNAKSAKNIVLAPQVVNAAMKANNKFVPKAIQQQLADLGYTAVVTYNKSVNRQLSKAQAAGVALKSQWAPVDDALFEQAAQSQPFFRTVGTALNRVGLGIDETTAISYRMVRDNAVQDIEKAGLKNGRTILNALQQWTDQVSENRFADLASIDKIKRRTTTDLRMMTISEIQAALKEAGQKITTSEAKVIKNALIQAHLDVPLQTMGMADAIIARAYKYNPFHKTFARIQGALRYTYNPFFAVQEATETELLGQALAGGKKPYIAGMGALFKGTKAELDDVVARMDQAGFFTDSMLAQSDIGRSLMATRFGEAAQDVYLGRVSAVITKSQKRSIAAVVQKFAEKANMSVEEALTVYGAELEDLVRPIVQYPTKGALQSNMAKMMNIAMFPSRYNTKVTALAVKSLSQAPPSVQVMTINKLWEFESWVRSPEGVAWQQDNKEAIAFFSWLTPLGSVQWVFDTLLAPFGKGHQSLGDWGMIGGLPFGVITQILESQGVVTINSPYVSPEDGEIYAKRIPDSMKARTASAFMDLLGYTFTYPGRQIGLPGKGAFLRDTAEKVGLGTTRDEWSTYQPTVNDLPEYDKMRQQIWEERYNLLSEAEQKEVDAQLQAFTRSYTPVEQPTAPEKLTRSELNQLKVDAKTAKGAATKKRKTTTFPTNLPQ